MKFIKILAITISISIFVMACSQSQPQEIVVTNQTPENETEIFNETDDDYWARENFDLQRVGEVLEKSKDAEEFESR